MLTLYTRNQVLTNQFTIISKNRIWFLMVALMHTCSVKMQGIDMKHKVGASEFTDYARVNVSQDQYTNKVSIYLDGLDEYERNGLVYQLQSIEGDILMPENGSLPLILFPELHLSSNVKEAELRVLLPPLSNSNSATVRIYGISDTDGRNLLDERRIHFSQTFVKWNDFDVTDGVQHALNEGVQLKIEMECVSCTNNDFRPLKAFVNVVIYTNHRLVRASNIDNIKNTPKADLCRVKKMKVVFRKLKQPLVDSIIFPRSYQAGICKGQCLPDNAKINYATIQRMLVDTNENIMSHSCCVPTKYDKLKILRIDPYDPDEVIEEIWEKMSVVECGCT